MDCVVLGPLSVHFDGNAPDLGGRKCRSILAMLILDAPRVVSIDELIDGVWGDTAAPGARKSVQVYISQLRAAIETDRGNPVRLVTVAPGYAFRPTEGDTVDAQLFLRLVDQGRAAAAGRDFASAVTHFRNALGLWSGEVVADLFREPFWHDIAPLWQERRIAAVEEWFDARLALGEHDGVLDSIAAEATANPLRERLSGQWMLALYRAGRQGEALAVFRRTKHLLADELGVDPGRAIAGLELAILRQDADLDLPADTEVITSRGLEPEPAATPAALAHLALGTAIVWLADWVTTPGASLDVGERETLLDEWRSHLVAAAQAHPPIEVLDQRTVLARILGPGHAQAAAELQDRTRSAPDGGRAGTLVQHRSATRLGWLQVDRPASRDLESTVAQALAVASGHVEDTRVPSADIAIGVGTDLGANPFGETVIPAARLEYWAAHLTDLPPAERELLEFICLLGSARTDLLARLAGIDPSARLHALVRNPIGHLVCTTPVASVDGFQAVAVVLAGMPDRRRAESSRRAAIVLGAVGGGTKRIVELLETAVLIEAATTRQPDSDSAELAAEELSRWGWQRCSRGDDTVGAAILARAVLQALLAHPVGDPRGVATAAIAAGAGAAHAGHLMDRFTTAAGVGAPQPAFIAPWLNASATDARDRMSAALGSGTGEGDKARLRLAIALLHHAGEDGDLLRDTHATAVRNERDRHNLTGGASAWRNLVGRVQDTSG